MLELQKVNQEFARSPKVARLTTKVSPTETPEVIQKEQARKDKELEKIAGLYVEAEGNLEMLTLANDLLLRLFLRLDLDATASQSFFDDLGRRISMKEAAKKRYGDEQRERDRAETVKQSIEQLANFIKSEDAKHPEVIFASSPELDEIRGVNLLKCHPVWDAKEHRLILDIELVQAKSGVMDAEEIRDLGRVYQSTQRRIEREFVLSKKWVRDTAKEVTPSVPEISINKLFEYLTDQKALIDLLNSDPDEPFAALRNFHRTVIVYGLMNELCRQLDEENPYKVPDIELRSLKFFLLVNTEQGPKYLTVEQAINYK